MSLTTVSITARKTIRYSIYGLVVIIIARFLFIFGVDFYKRAFPTPPPPPNVAFGPLPAIAWVTLENLPPLEYKLETADGSLPFYPDQMPVLRFIRGTVNLGTIDQAKSKAKNLGFTSEPEEISPTVLRFKSTTKPQTLELDSVSGIFSISYNLSQDATPIAKTPPTAISAQNSIKSYLGRVGAVPDDISNGVLKHNFLAIESEKLIEVASLSEAKMVKINLFRKDQEVKSGEETLKIPTVTKNFIQANIWFYVGGDSIPFAGEYKYFPLDQNIIATYPIKDIETAINELANGKGHIANLGGNTDGKITIRKGYMGYYDPDSEQDDYFQPVYVFEGDRGFVGYVPAVTDQYYGQLQK